MKVSTLSSIAFRQVPQAVCEGQSSVLLVGVVKHNEQNGTYEAIC
jgi:hypothetical protein